MSLRRHFEDEGGTYLFGAALTGWVIFSGLLLNEVGENIDKVEDGVVKSVEMLSISDGDGVDIDANSEAPVTPVTVNGIKP